MKRFSSSRTLGALLCAALLAACTGGGGAEARLPLEGPEGDTKAKVLVVGGSVMGQMGIALEAALESTGWVDVVNEAGTYGAFGEEQIVNLRGQWAELVARHRPDVVLVQVTLTTPEVDCVGDAATRADCLEEGLDLYRRLTMTEITDVLSDTGADVVWVEFPLMDSEAMQQPDMNELLERLNAAARAVADEDDRLTVVDSAAVLTKGGEFDHWIEVQGGYRQIRKPDGVHLCPFGAELVADRLAGELVQDWSAYPRSWVDGEWRSDPTFTEVMFAFGAVGCTDEVVAEAEPMPERVVEPPASAEVAR